MEEMEDKEEAEDTEETITETGTRKAQYSYPKKPGLLFRSRRYKKQQREEHMILSQRRET